MFLSKKKYSKKILLKTFNQDLNIAITDFRNKYPHKNQPLNIKEVIIEMIFQLGIKKQKKFVKMNSHIQKNNIFLAALEMKNSLWYKQTPKRVDGLIKLLLKKEYEKKR